MARIAATNYNSLLVLAVRGSRARELRRVNQPTALERGEAFNMRRKRGLSTVSCGLDYVLLNISVVAQARDYT